LLDGLPLRTVDRHAFAGKMHFSASDFLSRFGLVVTLTFDLLT